MCQCARVRGVVGILGALAAIWECAFKALSAAAVLSLMSKVCRRRHNESKFLTVRRPSVVRRVKYLLHKS